MASIFRHLQAWLEDLIFPIRLRLSPRLVWSPQRKIVRFSPSTLVKGPCREQELEALLYVASRTDVIVPKVVRVYRRTRGWDVGLWICMEFIRGESMESAWERADDSTRRMWARKVMDGVTEMKRLRPPGALGLVVASIEGGSVIDGILSEAEVGPFATVAGFREETLQSNPNLAEYRELWDHDTEVRCVLSHADLSPRNVIVRSSDGEPVIVDWEFAGWWPEYWERIKWQFADFPRAPGWVEMMDELDELRG